MPVSRIPIVNKNLIGTSLVAFGINLLTKQYKPDIIIILVWNLKKEVMKKLKYIKKWNGKFVTFIPNLKIY